MKQSVNSDEVEEILLVMSKTTTLERLAFRQFQLDIIEPYEQLPDCDTLGALRGQPMKPFKAVEPEREPAPPPVEREAFIKALLAKPFIADVQIFDDIKDAIVIEEITFSDGSKILFDIYNSDYDTAWVSVEYEPSNQVVHYNDNGELSFSVFHPFGELTYSLSRQDVISYWEATFTPLDETE